MKTKLNKIFAAFYVFFLAALFVSVAEAFTYSAATKTARMTAVKDTIDAGAGPGVIEIGTTGMATVCISVTLDDPSGSVAGSVLTFAGFPKTVVATATCSPVAEARIKDSSGNTVISGLTVGTSGTDVVIDNTSVNSGQTSTVLASPTFTHY